MQSLRDKRSLTLLELLIMLCIIFVFLGVFALYANTTLRIARETALQMELNNIRMSIEHYRIVNNRFPQDINTLFNQGFSFETPDGIIIHDNYLKPFRLDKQEKLLDPFLNRYYYDSSNGTVKTQTKGYESW